MASPSHQADRGVDQADRRIDPTEAESWQDFIIRGNSVIDGALSYSNNTLKLLRAEADLSLASLKWMLLLAFVAAALCIAGVVALNGVIAGAVAVWLEAGWTIGWGVALLVDMALCWLAVSAAVSAMQEFGFSRTWRALSESISEQAPGSAARATGNSAAHATAAHATAQGEVKGDAKGESS